MIFGRQPAFWVGLAVTLILGALQTIQGEGLVSDVQAGQVTDAVNAVGQLLILAGPLLAGLLIRPLVTPTAKPAIPQGTTVTVITPANRPNETVVL